MQLFLKSYPHAVLRYQVFLSNTNNLDTDVCLQVFLPDINIYMVLIVVCLRSVLIAENLLYTKALFFYESAGLSVEINLRHYFRRGFLTSEGCWYVLITGKKSKGKGGSNKEKSVFCRWNLVLFNSISVFAVPVLVCVGKNRKHSFWSNFCTSVVWKPLFMAGKKKNT